MTKVVYTCINGKYDTLKEPTIVSKDWDYICFCDEYPDHEEDTVWKIITIGSTKDIIRYQRKKKIYNEWIFDSYDYSIWVDGSIRIQCDLDTILNPMIESGFDFSLMKHPAQTCIVGEARGILMLRKDKKEVLDNQINTYFQEGYPKDYGMVATGIMARKHTEEIKEFCRLWYNEVEKHSLRDQMSFNYTTWKKPINYCLMPFNILQKQFKIHNHLKRKEF